MTNIKKKEILAAIHSLLERLTEDEPEKEIISAAAPDTVEMLTIKECTNVIKGLNEYTVRRLVARNELPYIRCGEGKRGKILIPQVRADRIFQRQKGMNMDEIFKLLNPDNTVSLNRPLAHALGTNEAIIYSALIAKQLYYEKRGMLDDDGYFYSTIDDLKESTSLSKRQQSGAIKVLIDAGLIDCKRRGIPGRRCFRVSDDIELLNKIIERGKSIMSELKPFQNVPTSGNKTAQQVGTKCNDKSEQNAPYTYNLNNKTKVIKLNQSIPMRRIGRMFQQRIVRWKNAPSISKLSGITSITNTKPKKKKSTRSLRLCSM